MRSSLQRSMWLFFGATTLSLAGGCVDRQGSEAGADVRRDGDAAGSDGGMDTGERTCASDDDCVGSASGSHCELGSGRCRACLPNPNTCGPRTFCDSTYRCTAGCSTDGDCTSGDGGAGDGGSSGGRCNTMTHQCVECLGEMDCPSALICRDNRCRVGCSDARPCAAGSDCCDGACIDLIADPMHCGSCVNACDSGRQCCGGVCFDLASDARNCGTCGNVCSIPGAVAACMAGRCVVGTCSPGTGDCDGNPSNGCEVNVTGDSLNCGRCGTVCPRGPRAVPSCTGGICSSTCSPGYLHCSANPLDGCEVDPATDRNNCGVCGRVCSGAHGIGGCAMGLCTLASCDMGYADCNGIPDDGCEVDLGASAVHCGACFRTCPAGPYATAMCRTGTCSLTCVAGRGDCDAMSSNGCESDFTLDARNCGRCSNVCPIRANATAACSAGACTVACTGLFRDCDRDATNGCEVDPNSDVRNCGACGAACVTPNATPRCTAGACAVSSCNAGFGNCNGVAVDGCEVNTSNNPLNCAACGNVCPSAAFASPTCTGGTCGFSCLSGYANCNGSTADGCEVFLANDVDHCGTCATVCPNRANSVRSCSTGLCSFVCSGAFRDCDASPANGCETDITSTASSCGACGMNCVLPNAVAGCSGARCVVSSCAAGFGNCNGLPGDGCEVALANNPANCGACFRSCPAGPFSTATCGAGVCGLTCAAGHGDCNGVAADGCEITFASDPVNCGLCGRVCVAPANADPTCAASTCGFTCRAGFRDCNALAADGCEINIRTDANNCGACGARCTTPNATPACSSSVCAVASCNAGFANCNGLVPDGCEINTQTDSSNCGACGTVCTGGRICVTGVCTLVNPFPSTGAEGAFNPAVNTVLPPGVHNYTTINVPVGVTVTTSGTGILDLRATGDVTIAGVINASGGPGGSGDRMLGGGGGGYTGTNQTAPRGTPGSPGLGGNAPAGSNGTGCAANGLGGTNGGGSGTVGTTTVGGGGGGGAAGGAGGLVGGACIGGPGGGGAPSGAGGQAGGPPYDGLPGQSGSDPCSGLVAGAGGGSIGGAAAMDLAMATTFQPGSGGGAGSGSYAALAAAGGGGGGGGGAVRIASPTRITVSGSILASGGAGGAGSPANATCFAAEGGAGGGGGSAGAIYLAAPILNVGGTLSAVGGAGGARGANCTGGDGGAGGLGRIRFSVDTATCMLPGTFNPPLRSACGLANASGFAYIAGYPR